MEFAAPIGREIMRRKAESSIVPVSNLPSFSSKSGLPSEHDFEVMRFERRIAQVTADLRNANDKISSAILTLTDELRFLTLGLRQNQWETYSQLERRISRLQGAIGNLTDQTPGRHLSTEILQETLVKKKAVIK